MHLYVLLREVQYIAPNILAIMARGYWRSDVGALYPAPLWLLASRVRTDELRYPSRGTIGITLRLPMGSRICLAPC